MTGTATPAVTPASTFFNFATDTGGWNYETGAALNSGYNADPVYSAAGTTGSAYVYCEFDGTYSSMYFSKNFSSPYLDLTGKIIKAYIYVPADLAALTPPYTAHITIIPTGSAGGQGIASGGYTNLDTPGWKLLQYTPSSFSNTGAGSVLRVAVGVNRTAPNDWFGTFYVDEISW